MKNWTPDWNTIFGTRGQRENVVFSLRCHFACFPVLGVLLAFRTAMQAMGQKLIPVVPGGFELFIKVAAGLWLIPLYGYVAACVAEPAI